MPEPMEIRLGDVVRLRKPHPCGGYEWRVVRLGADIGIKCLTCGRRVLLPRRTFGKQVKAFIERGEERRAAMTIGGGIWGSITKVGIRQRVWEMLERENIAAFPRPCFGRIPNFVGSDEATMHLLELDEFKQAHCVFCAPDHALKRARDLVLERSKVLAVATPHMRSFLEIHLKGRPISTTIKGLFKHGEPLVTPVDLIVRGSVAVDRFGNRLGKGKGYGDQEVTYLRERGLATPDVKVVTIVHEAQILDDLSHLMDENDIPVDYILTPSRVIRSLDYRKGTREPR